MPTSDDMVTQRAACLARVEALERMRARQLASMTEERAMEIIESLVAVDAPRQQPENWSGLVEQQALFAKWRRRATNQSGDSAE